MIKKYLIYCVVLISTCTITCTINISQITVPKAFRGDLDLSSWSFEKNGMVALNGEWEFYWQQLLNPADFTSSRKNTSRLSGYFSLPGNWTRFKTSIDMVTPYGYATLHLKIPLKEVGIYSLRIPGILTAYKFWINGNLLASAGIVGTTLESCKPFTYAQIIDFYTEKNNLDIVLQISNFDDISGGVTSAILLGTNNQIHEYQKFLMLCNMTIFGAILIFGMYHFGLFLLRKKDLSAFCLSIICFVIAINIFITELVLNINIYANFNWELIKKMSYITMVLCSSLYFAFISFLYPGEVSRKLLYAINGLYFLMLIIFLVTPFRFYVQGLLLFQIIVLFTALYIGFIITQAVLHRRKNSAVFLTGYLVLLVTTVNDILYTNDIVHTGFLTHFGFFALILAQAMLIALRFNDLFKQVENLSADLQLYSNQLERKVEERTRLLEESQIQKADFFVNFSHEIKTPLTLILNYLEKDIKHRGLSDDIKIVAYNLKKFKQDILNFLELEKLNRNQVFFNHEQVVNVSVELKTKVFIFKDLALQKEINLTSQIQSDLFIMIDPLALDRIWNNLLDNALKFTPHGGKINLHLYNKDDTVGFSIQDTGIGIPLEEQSKIFQPYYQISYNKRNTQGIGMGLSIIKKILDDIHGEIKVISEPSLGTTFVIIFKQYLPENMIQIQTTSINESPLAHIEITLKEETFEKGKPTIFIIDDNIQMLYYLQTSLEKKYNIFYAINGQNAISKLPQIPKPQLIISDIMMDKMDGYGVLEFLMHNKIYRHIPLIFLTAKTIPQDILAGLKKGAVDYICKPFILDELLAKVDSIVKQQAHYHENQIRKIENKFSRFLRSGLSKEKGKKNQTVPKEKNWFDYDFAPYKISKKEKKIIEMLIKGYEYKQISSELNISLNTLKPYINTLYKKLNVHSKIDLINFLSSRKASITNS